MNRIRYKRPQGGKRAAGALAAVAVLALALPSSGSAAGLAGVNLGGSSGLGVNLGGSSGLGVNLGGSSGVGVNLGGSSGLGVNLGGNSGLGINLGANPTGAGAANGGGSASHGGVAAAILPLTPGLKPVLGRRVNLNRTNGVVLVRAPGGARFVPLAAGASIPVGSTIDATHGAVTLTSIRDASGAEQSGTFWGGRFRVEQASTAEAKTVIVLAGRLACPVRRAPRRLVMSAGRRISYRQLWGRDHHGHFVTRGRYGAASVRGTVWLTRDGCAGTFFRVKRGAVDVHDYRLHRTVALSAGKTYLARKRR